MHTGGVAAVRCGRVGNQKLMEHHPHRVHVSGFCGGAIVFTLRRHVHGRAVAAAPGGTGCGAVTGELGDTEVSYPHLLRKRLGGVTRKQHVIRFNVQVQHLFTVRLFKGQQHTLHHCQSRAGGNRAQGAEHIAQSTAVLVLHNNRQVTALNDHVHYRHDTRMLKLHEHGAFPDKTLQEFGAVRVLRFKQLRSE